MLAETGPAAPAPAPVPACSTPHIIQSQLQEVLGSVVYSDFPQAWPTLLDTIMGHLTSNVSSQHRQHLLQPGTALGRRFHNHAGLVHCPCPTGCCFGAAGADMRTGARGRLFVLQAASCLLEAHSKQAVPSLRDQTPPSTPQACFRLKSDCAGAHPKCSHMLHYHLCRTSPACMAA